MTNLFMAAILNNSEFETILVKFKNRNYEAKFPAWCFEDLKTDPITEYILNAETGEILYEN